MLTDGPCQLTGMPGDIGPFLPTDAKWENPADQSIEVAGGGTELSGRLPTYHHHVESWIFLDLESQFNCAQQAMHREEVCASIIHPLLRLKHQGQLGEETPNKNDHSNGQPELRRDSRCADPPWFGPKH